MARSYRYCVFASGALATLMALATAQPSWAQDEKPPISTTAKQPDIKEIAQAVEKFKQRDIAGAKKLLEDAYKAHPELPPPPIILAQFFAQANQGAFMRLALEDAAMNYPADPESYVLLANIALQERRVMEASLLYAKATDLLPKLTSPKRKEILDPQTVSGLAGVAETRASSLEQGPEQKAKWKEAQTLLEKLLPLMPKSTEADAGKAQAMLRLARAKFQQGNATGAYEDLKAAFALDKEKILTPEAALGGFYEQYGDRDKAKKWMGYAVQYYPKHLQTRLAVGRWAMETGQMDEALKQADAALQTDNKSLEAMLLRGVLALFKKDFVTAEKNFKEVQERQPGLFAATNNLALALCEQKDSAQKNRALEWAKNNFQQNNSQQNPRFAEAASTLGWVYYRLGDLSMAKKALMTAVQAGGNSPDTLYYLAQVLYDEGGKPDAKKLVEAALKQDPKGGERPFSMRPEAQELFNKLKDDPAAVSKPDATPKKDSP